MFRVHILGAFLLLFYCSITYGGVASFDEFDLVPSMGPSLFWQETDWLSCDTSLSFSDQNTSSSGEFSSDTALFNHIEYACIDTPLASAFSLSHAPYFVSVFNEGAVNFTVRYCDNYENAPSTGYPRLTWWSDGQQPESACMGLSETGAGYWTYAQQVTPRQTGLHYYYYTVRNPQTDEYQCSVSSFVVATRPVQCTACGIANAAVVSTARLAIRWTQAPAATYRLYVGDSPQTLTLAYQGTDTSFEFTTLAYGRRYYWQIEACNEYGISSRSPVYSFSTIASPSRAFNYPNPFNPGIDQQTSIVFDMPDAGSAEIRIYTEWGDLCWQRTYDNLLTGANEISYDGKDDNGNTLFNGTYLCRIVKRGGGRQSKDSCRLLVIK